MKVQCDVCAAEAASVFCCADEAALCDGCDRRVHRANKLAGKHRRLSLLHPSPSSSSSSASSGQKPPLCDICQEKRGFLFCKEDRAILCRDCDVQVHTASELTRRHSRFLLTGVRVSSAPAVSPAPSEEEAEENISSPCNADSCSGAGAASATASVSDGSSISEYLTKTLPGWHVEDFLLDDAAASAAVAVSSHAPYNQEGLAHIGGLQEGYPAWAGRGQLLSDVVVAADERASRELWVPQMHAEWAGSNSKRPRAASPPPCSYWATREEPNPSHQGLTLGLPLLPLPPALPPNGAEIDLLQWRSKSRGGVLGGKRGGARCSRWPVAPAMWAAGWTAGPVDEDMTPPDTITTTTTSSTSLADEERDKCKTSKFKRGITVIKIKINKHKSTSDDGRILKPP